MVNGTDTVFWSSPPFFQDSMSVPLLLLDCLCKIVSLIAAIEQAKQDGGNRKYE